MPPTRVVHYYREALRQSGVTNALFGLQSICESAGIDTLTLHAPAEETTESAFLTRGLPHAPVPHLGTGRQASIPVNLPLDPHRDILILHEGWTNSNYEAARQACRLGVPYVVVPHGVYEPGIMNGLHFPRIRAAVFEERYLQNAALVHLFLPDEPKVVRRISRRAHCFVVPPVLPLIPSIDTIAAPTAPFSARESISVGWYGRYAPFHKGLDRLLCAIALIPRAQRPYVKLHGVPYKSGIPWLEAFVSRLDLTDHVSIGGPLNGDSEKLEFLSDISCFAFPSRWESFGISLFEALSAGVPVVTSDGIQFAGLLDSEHAATVIDFDDPMVTARALVQAAIEQRRGDRSPGRQFVLRYFDQQRIADSYLNGLSSVRTGAHVRTTP